MTVPKWTDVAQAALKRNNDFLGFDISKVLDDEDWGVAKVGDTYEVIVDIKGIRKLALFSPDQEKATRFVGELENFLKNRNK